MANEREVEERIQQLAQTMRAKGLAFSDSQARERARDIVMQEVKMQANFEAMKDDPEKNPQQRTHHVSQDALKQHGLLTGTELPKDVPLADLLKGRNK